ncbi:Rpn family recombination-promoting nuclease/putative transposase [bacterium]|nr:Rpn family recombination-promoting nuclease/putative transposase [bacterium]
MNVTLLNDILFKVVFGSQRHSEALRGLLNAILGLQGDSRITEITILNPLREKEHLEDKSTVLDVKARDGHGATYNIEVQVQAQVAYRERSLFYAANMISQQIEAGQDYRLLKKTIHISLTDFVLFPKQADLHSTYLLYDLKHQRTLGDLLELHYLEMAKFRKADLNELQDSLDRWLFFLRNATHYEDVSDLPDLLKIEEGMTTAMEATHNAMCDAEVRYAIEARQKWERDRITEMNAAIEEGEARGKAEGRTEALQEIARALLSKGMSEDLIFEATGLRLSEL